MTAHAVPRRAIFKEAHALAPTFAAAALAVGAALTGDPLLIRIALVGYAIGCAALGAQSIGHEYTLHTVGLLLSQPVDRRRVFLVKIAVLAVALVALATVAWLALFTDRAMPGGARWRPVLALVPLACGLFLAPWLTMISRSALAGGVFTIAIPGSVVVAGTAIAGTISHASTADPELLRRAIVLGGIAACCAAGGILGWRTFTRLEAIDGAAGELRLGRWPRRAAAPRRRHPVWLLVKKELHLQRMSFAIAALYVFGWMSVFAEQHAVPELTSVPLFPLTVFYLLTLAVLMGAIASADERQYGTHEWQMLLPVAAWQQWAVKVGTVLVLTLALSVGLPALLTIRGSRVEAVPLRFWRQAAVYALVLAAVGLYVSSLCRSGVKALLLSFAGLAGALLFLQVASLAAVSMRIDSPRRAYARPDGVIAIATTALLVTLLLVFGHANHRRADRPARVVWQQIAAIALLLIFPVLLLI